MQERRPRQPATTARLKELCARGFAATAARWQRTGRVGALLTQGLTTKELALSMSSGAVIGVFPVLGSTTAFCLVLAMALRLNLVAIQALNYLVYPLQILLLLPFAKLGEHLFSAIPVELSLEQLRATFAQGWLHAVVEFRDLLLSAVLGWAVSAIPTGVALHYVLMLLLRHVDVAALIPRQPR